MGEDSFFCLGKKYYFTQKLSFLINILFKNVFQALGVITLYKLNNATVCETPMIKSISSLEKVFSSLKTRFSFFPTLYPCPSLFSLFKLMQLVCLVMEW